jgi:hypothetical protein
MASVKVMVNRVNILVLPDFRKVLKEWEKFGNTTGERLVGIVVTPWDGEYNLEEVMTSSRFSIPGLQDAKRDLMATIAEYDKVTINERRIA